MATIQSLTCVWTARGEAVAAELRESADVQPLANVLQLARQARALGQAAAVAQARSAVTARARKCFSKVSTAARNWSAGLLDHGRSSTGACRLLAVTQGTCSSAISCCVVSVATRLSRISGLSQVVRSLWSTAGTNGDASAGSLGCLCKACAVMATMQAPLGELERLGLQRAAAATKGWLQWCCGCLAATHVRSKGVSCVSPDYFGTILPCVPEPPESSSGTSPMDICLDAIAKETSLSNDALAPALQPVISGEHVRLLAGLTAFQDNISRAASYPHNPASEASTNSCDPGHDGDISSDQELTADMLQAFAGNLLLYMCNAIRMNGLRWRQTARHAHVQVVKTCQSAGHCMSRFQG